MQSAEAKTTKHNLTGEGCVTQPNSYLFLQILDIIHDIHPRQCNFTATGSVFYIKPCLSLFTLLGYENLSQCDVVIFARVIISVGYFSSG